MNAAQVNADISALLRARNPLIWIRSREEARVERALISSCGAAKYPVRYWDCSTGITGMEGEAVAKEITDPKNALDWLRGRRERMVLVMRDLHKWTDPVVTRTLRSLCRELMNAPPKESRSVIVLAPDTGEIPAELSDARVIDYPLPDREEVARILESTLGSLPEGIRVTAVTDANRDRVIDAALGLSANEIQNSFAKSLVTAQRIDPEVVTQDKKSIIAREKVLTWHEPDPRGLDAVGGLDVLKAWLTARRAAFTPEARAFGLPAPKGAFLLGISGCGKSLTAKAVASAWGLPLLRLDMGALRSKFVGESESNIRRALQVAGAVSPCVLWMDEIEKAMAGASGPAGDGGVSADAFGAVLTWMNDHTEPVFVIATANDVRGMPPELLRKGRFDELFWIDLPTSAERSAIVETSIRERDRATDPARRWHDPALIDLDEVARITEGFTGAEIAAIVPDALFAAFADGRRPLTTADLVAAAGTVTPLSKTASEKIDGLRSWSKGRARAASTPESTATGDTRTLDL